MNATPEGSKISRLDTFKQVQKSRGVTPRELQNAPRLSWQHDSCWNAYVALRQHTWPELESYMRVTGKRLMRWEIDAVMTLARYKDQEPVWTYS